MADVGTDGSDDVEGLLDVECGTGHEGVEVENPTGCHPAPKVDAANHGHQSSVGAMDSRLPLLTVDTVIFPGLVIAIPVTDVQGRAVVRDLVENGGELVCGAVAVRDGYELGDRVFRSLYGTGCAATISEITLDAGDDGPVEVTLTGNRRFKVTELDTGGDYLLADVEWLPELAGDDAPGTASVAIQRFRRYAAAVTEISQPGLHIGSLPDDPGTLSYLISAAMTLLTPDRQKLLEAADTTTRLAQLVGLLDAEMTAMAALPSLPAVDLARSEMAPN
jgi:uncharacterized protein